MKRAARITALVAGATAAGWFFSRARRKVATAIPTAGRKPRIVVAGAGFAGISTLEALVDELPPDSAEVLLIDRHSYHLFTPLLYQVATGAVDSANITYSLRRFCTPSGFRFLATEIYGVDPMGKSITTAAGQISYDYLVLGLGSQTNYFGMDALKDRTFGLKSVPDAAALRRRIFQNFERAAQTTDRELKRRLLTFIVVGGGATGIELVGSIHELVQNNLLRYYPEVDEADTRIILVEAGDRVLFGIDDRLGKLALKRFDELGIEVRLKTMVADVRDGAVITRAGERIPGDVIVWTAGIRPNPITAGMAVEKARDGRLIVDEHLRIPGLTSNFALGDNAASVDPATGKPLPPNAAVAVQQGAATGRNIARLIRGEPLLPFVYEPMGELIALGRLRAAAELGPFVFDGLVAWVIWRLVYLSKIMGVKNRAGLLLDWFASLFAHREIIDAEAGD